MIYVPVVDCPSEFDEKTLTSIEVFVEAVHPSEEVKVVMSTSHEQVDEQDEAATEQTPETETKFESELLLNYT